MQRTAILTLLVLGLVGSPLDLQAKESADGFRLTWDAAPRTQQDIAEREAKLQQNPADVRLQMEVIRDNLEIMRADTWDRLDKGVSFLEDLAERFPKKADILMLYGQVLGARALDQNPSSLTRLRWARNAFKAMDQAVELDEDNQLLRLLRAEAALMAHPILRRQKTLEKDVTFLFSFFASKDFQTLTPFQQARLHLFMGTWHSRKEQTHDARSHWQQAQQLAEASSTIAKEATARLSGTYNGLGFDG